jgi:hypothetical protein
MRVDRLSGNRELGDSPSVRMLAQARKFALRRGVWFRALNRVERAIIDLTLQCVDTIKSGKLAKLLTAIMDKLQSTMESIVDRLVRTIGVALAEKISCTAVGWGNVSAKSWASDWSFAVFLAVASTNK